MYKYKNRFHKRINEKWFMAVTKGQNAYKWFEFNNKEIIKAVLAYGVQV